MRKLHCLLMGKLLPIGHRLLSLFRLRIPNAGIFLIKTHKKIKNALPGELRMFPGSLAKVCVTQC